MCMAMISLHNYLKTFKIIPKQSFYIWIQIPQVLHTSVVVVLVTQSCPTLCDAMGCVARQAPLPMVFSRQEYWGESPFPSPEDLPDPGIELRSPALQADSLLFELQGI